MTRTVRVDRGWDEARARSRSIGRGSLVLGMAGLAIDEIHDATIDELPSDVADALTRVAPAVDIATLAEYPADGLNGLANSVKGGLFEARVAEAIEDGSLGEVTLLDGASLQLTGFTQEGYDAEILDANGDTMDVIQLKASDNADLVAEHLSRFPEIEVWTTSEAALDATERGLPAFDTGTSDADLSEHVGAAFADQTSTSLGEVLDEVIPQLTLVLVAARWLVARRAGATPEEAKIVAMKEVRAALVSSTAAGLAAHLTGTDAVRVPVVLTVRLLAARGRLASQTAAQLRTLAPIIERARPQLSSTPA